MTLETGDPITSTDFPSALEGEGLPEEQQTLSGLQTLFSYTDYHNIAEELDDSKLSEIGQRVVREYLIDDNSRADWKAQNKRAMDLARQVVEQKNYPWPKAANVKFPLITTASIQFAARAYPAIVPGADVVKGRVVGSDEGVPLFDQNGLPVPMIDEATGMPVIGPDGMPMPQWELEPGAKQAKADRVASHLSFQLTEEIEEWEGDTDTLLHVVPIAGCAFRKTWYSDEKGRVCSAVILPENLVVNQKARSLESAARVTQEFELYPFEYTERVRSGLYKEVDLGLPPNSTDDTQAPHLFLEQHRYEDMDEDGLPEPYIVTVHKETMKVVKMCARFDLEGIRVNEQNQVVRVEPVPYFTKYGLIPDPNGGFYDMGFGQLLGLINETVNTTINAMLDAGHLQNAPGGFIAESLKIGGKSSGVVRTSPGEYKRVQVPPNGNLTGSVLPLTFPGPSAVLFNLLGMLIQAGKEISSVQDVMTGDQERNQPATTTLALIEQGMKVFSAVFKRLHRSLKVELRQIFRLNRLYMSDQVYFRILDKPGVVAKEDYDPETVDIVPVSDPSVVTDMQRMAKAEFLMGFTQDPFVNPIELRSRIFKGVGVEDVETLLMPPAPPMMPPEGGEGGEGEAKPEKGGGPQLVPAAA